MPASRILAFAAAQPLTHRGRRGQEGARDRRRVEAEDDLQHERRVHAAIDVGVRADEQQLQPLVGKPAPLVHRRPVRVPHQQPDGRLRIGAHAFVPRPIDQPPPRRRQQPRFGLGGHAVARPGPERRQEGVRQRILRRRDVARARREVGHQPPVRLARDVLDDAARVVSHFR